MTDNDADKWPSRRPNQHPSGKAFDPAQLICAISQLRNDAAPSKTAAVGGLSEPYTTRHPEEERGYEWRLAWHKKAPDDAGAFGG
jgi:hypothetical protein